MKGKGWVRPQAMCAGIYSCSRAGAPVSDYFGEDDSLSGSGGFFIYPWGP